MNDVVACCAPFIDSVPFPGKGEAPFSGPAGCGFGGSGTISTTISEWPAGTSFFETICPERWPNELISK